jgi:outer membrane lipoprotein-sorting protein
MAAIRKGLAASLLVLLTAACATTRPGAGPALRRSPRAATLDEVLTAYDAYCRGFDTLRASGDLDVRDLRSGKSQKLGVRVVAARGGRLFLKGSVAVVSALEVVSDGRQFWLQLPTKRKVWTGDASLSAPEAVDEKAPYYVLRPSDVTTALVPEPLAPGPEESVVLEADSQNFSLTLARMDGGRGVARRRVWLSRDTLLPSQLRVYDARGDVVSDSVLSSFRDGAPRSVTIRRPAEGYEAAFSLDEVERNVAVPEKAFTGRVPEGFAVVEVH